MRNRLSDMIQNAVGGCAKNWADIIADYLLENGVIVPPCKVGDMVWIAGEYRGVYSATVRTFFFSHSGIEMIRTTKCDIPFSDFGKVGFLTREEAEKALERIENGK